MAKDASKVLKFIVSKVEVGESTDGNEPGTYTDIGFPSESVLTVKAPPSNYPVGDGSEYQKAYECSVETEGLEIINVAAIETAAKNKNIWIKATPVGTVSVSNPIVRVKNFIGNIEAAVDLSVKGKSAFKVTGKKYVVTLSDFLTTLGS